MPSRAINWRVRPESFADHYSQARLFFRSLDVPEQAHLASALVFELSKVGLEHVRKRVLSNLVNVDPALAQRVADGLNMDVPPASPISVEIKDLALSPALRIIGGPLEKHTLEGRAVGILIADGSDGEQIDKLTSQIGDAGGKPILIAPKVGGAKLKDGSTLKADAQLAGFPSVFVDAVALVLSAEGTAALLKEAAAVQFRDGCVRAPESDRRDRCGTAVARQGGRGKGWRRDRTRQGLPHCCRQALFRSRAGRAHVGVSARTRRLQRGAGLTLRQRKSMA